MFPQKIQIAIVAIFATFLLASCSSGEENLIEEQPKISPQSLNTFQTIESTSLEITIAKAINLYRNSIGKSKLEMLNIIKIPALEHTNYMMTNSIMNHDNFNERAEFLIDNANATSVSENLAFGFSNIQELIDAWVDSEGHRANIEGNFTHFNIIARQDQAGRWYYTNIFIKK